MTDIAQPRSQSYAFLPTEHKPRIVKTRGIRAIAFYGPILALLITFAAASQRPQGYQANLASDDFVTHYVSNLPPQ